MALNNPNDSLKAELAAKTGASPAQAPAAEAPAASPAAAQTNPMSTPAAASSASAPATPAGASPSNPYDYQNRIDTINQMFDSAMNRTRTNLDTAYEQNRRDLESNREEITRAYQNQRNANAADYERARRNFNQQALVNGLNTGAGSQAALAQGAVYSKNQGALRASEASANTELDRTMADLKIQYQNNINAAIAENDYNRAATLLDEYNNQYNMALNNAQLLSQYGDFSGFANLFGQDTADQMRQMWMYQNPGIAYSMGQITADEYHNLTGSYPPGYGGGYYYSGGGDNGGGTTDGGTTDGGTGISVDPTTGLEYIDDGNGLVPLIPDEGGTHEAEAPVNTRPVPDTIPGRPNTFAGARGGPNLDPDADPMAGRIGNKLDQTQRQPISEPVGEVAHRSTPTWAQPEHTAGIRQPDSSRYRRGDDETFGNWIQDIMTPDSYRKPDPNLGGNLYANGYWNNPDYMGANGEYVWPVKPDPVLGVNNLSGYIGTGVPVLTSSGLVRLNDNPSGAIASSDLFQRYQDAWRKNHPEQSQTAESADAARLQGATSTADLLARSGYIAGVTPGAARNSFNPVPAQDMADNQAEANQTRLDLQRRLFENGQREVSYPGNADRIRAMFQAVYPAGVPALNNGIPVLTSRGLTRINPWVSNPYATYFGR